ncbi:MAG: ABC transporter permease [Microbacterium sp.]
MARLTPTGALRPAWFRYPQWLRSPLAIIGVIVVVAWLLIAIFAPLIAPFDPIANTEGTLQEPSAAHLFGTDQLGRDVFSRVLFGSRVSIPLALMLVVMSMVIGSVLGAVAGYFGRVVDEIIMRITDLVFTFPTIILAMVIAAVLGPSLQNAVIAMLIVTWPSYARVMRSLVLSLRSREFVLADRLLGFSAWRVLVVDVLPNVAGSILVLATLDVGAAILLLSGLSYLGLGAVPPTPEWGSMISVGTEYMDSWWLAVYPGLAILSVVLAVNFIGDALRDALDPQTAGGTRAS